MNKFIFGIFLSAICMYTNPVFGDNEVFINQSGDNLELTILQKGTNNTIKSLGLNNDASLWGADKVVKLQQIGSNNDIGIWTSGSSQLLRGHIDGDSNDLFLDAHGNSVQLQADIMGDYNYAWLEAGASNSHVSNQITLWQAGDNHYAYLEALNGSSNVIDAYQGNGQSDGYIRAIIGSGGSSNNLKVWQGKHSDGSTDSDEVGDHEAYWTVNGDSNTLASYQTDVNRANGGAGHHLANIITGDNNIVEHIQKGKAGHDGFIEIDGNNNTVDLYQRGNGGVKWADIVLDGNGHTVDVLQKGGNAATATIDLTYGTGAYTLDLSQVLTSSSATYSITGTCYNAGGCSVSVNQNN
mgnify:CR=1 FL=1|tara:strand:- start:808 stop:1866 length:1059 start_codon:yes stop_codon:yes gene_type:complete